MNMLTWLGHRSAKIALAAALAMATATAGELSVERFGTIGITSGETARLSVVLLPAVQTECVVDIRIVDGMNRTLVAAQKVKLRPHIVEFIDLPGTNATLWASVIKVRPQIRAVVTPLYPLTGCNVAQTLELFDTLTGKTNVAIQQGN